MLEKVAISILNKLKLYYKIVL